MSKKTLRLAKQFIHAQTEAFYSSPDEQKRNYPKLGDCILIKEHGYCLHVGEVGIVVDVRFNNNWGGYDYHFGTPSKYPEKDETNTPFVDGDYAIAIRVSYERGKYLYWLPILKGEVASGQYKYFDVVPF